MSVILMTTVLQSIDITRKNLCWSLLGLKELKVTCFEKRSLNNSTIITWMGGRSHYKFCGGVVWTSWFKIMFTTNVKIQHFIVSGGSRSRGVPPPSLFLNRTSTEVLLSVVKSWKLERYIVLLLKKPNGLPWSFKPQYQHAYSSHCFYTSAGENLFKHKDTSRWWSFLHSHDLYVWSGSVIIGRNWMLVTFDQGLKGLNKK